MRNKMYIFFIISVIGMICIIPVYFLSVEHLKFQEKYGREKAIKLTEIFGLISGWGFFIFLFCIWISPQPRFLLKVFFLNPVVIPILSFTIPLFHLITSIPLILIAVWFGIVGVKAVTLKVAETHRPEKIITTGIYSRIRHPQYFGALLAHIGFSFLLSSYFSILITPLIALIIYILSWKEEKELLKEFGEEYEVYKKNVPMLFPKIRTKNR
jgi:protein-S-isoprenylcysteine O-methyltransferase Ste14